MNINKIILKTLRFFDVLRDHAQNRGFRGIIDLFYVLIFLRFSKFFTKYGSSTRYCPICKWTGAHYLPFRAGNYVDLEDVCPKCLTGRKHRWHFYFYKRIWKMDQREGDLLFIAPEKGIYDYLKTNPKLRIKTADLFEKGVDYKFDLIQSPLPDASFDFIICNHVIEHTKNDRLAMAECARMLKPNGHFIFSVPISYDLQKTIKFKKPSPLEHYHYYRFGSDFLNRVPKSLEVKRYISGDYLSPRHMKLLFIYPTDEIFWATKYN
jgi:SAM-dependent methyltransferase